jgi:pyruvate formate lyase activating enzyme
MKIAGIEKNSFVDYPGNIAAVLFTPGCNLNCYYCHNQSLIKPLEEKLINIESIIEWLATRKMFLDGVVISGGEPTLQAGLEEYIEKIKKLGYLVKLDTNGTQPLILQNLIEKNLIDYVAMDIKAPLPLYPEICGVDISTGHIEDSINLLMEGRVDYEFRTTFVPQLKEEDVWQIAKMIQGAKRYVLQQFRRPAIDDKIGDIRLFQSPHPPSLFTRVISGINGLVQSCDTRGI